MDHVHIKRKGVGAFPFLFSPNNYAVTIYIYFHTRNFFNHLHDFLKIIILFQITRESAIFHLFPCIKDLDLVPPFQLLHNLLQSLIFKTKITIFPSRINRSIHFPKKGGMSFFVKHQLFIRYYPNRFSPHCHLHTPLGQRRCHICIVLVCRHIKSRTFTSTSERVLTIKGFSSFEVTSKYPSPFK